MESLVNYSSEDEQDDYAYKKAAVRERSSGGAASAGRPTTGVNTPLKRSFEQSRISSYECESSYRKNRDSGKESLKSGGSVYNEDKYKFDRKFENSRDHKEKRDAKESRYNRDARDDDRDYESNKKYDHKKSDDHKLYREYKREYKRDSSDYNRDEKRYNRYEERKPSNTTSNKDRFSNSRSRLDERKQYDDRYNDERRGSNVAGSSFTDDRRKEHNDRRSYNNDEDRRNDRRGDDRRGDDRRGDDRRGDDRRGDDRRTQRSFNDDRSNTYRPRRSISPIPSHHSKGNRYSDRKEDSNTRRERKRHSRSRSRSHSRSHSPEKQIESFSALTKSSNLKMASAEHIGNLKRPEEESLNCERKILPTARNFEALLALPLSENASKLPNVVTVPVTSAAAGSNTTTVQLPSYYNPNVINPNKYVEQMQKRKLIWGAKKAEDSASKWGHAQFSQDQDGKVASKFMRLMGIKNATSTGGESSTLLNESEKKSPPATSPLNNTDVKSREAMFTTMEHQYEVARQVTHTMRGVGLGFSSQSRPY